jgi:hypothetical protein
VAVPPVSIVRTAGATTKPLVFALKTKVMPATEECSPPHEEVVTVSAPAGRVRLIVVAVSTFEHVSVPVTVTPVGAWILPVNEAVRGEP